MLEGGKGALNRPALIFFSCNLDDKSFQICIIQCMSVFMTELRLQSLHQKLKH